MKKFLMEFNLNISAGDDFKKAISTISIIFNFLLSFLLSGGFLSLLNPNFIVS
jgi:hypothetical protein